MLWASATGLKLIQLLPIHDTTATHSWRDSYPYAAISVHALHPLYLDVNGLSQSTAATKLLASMEPMRQELNQLEAVDYEAVLKCKWQIVKAIFPNEKKAVFTSASYQRFFQANKHWLEPYGCFSVLRDKYGTADFTTWSETKYQPELPERLMQLDAEALLIQYYVQYHLHQQLKSAVSFAHDHHCVLKGDIAIGVFKNSVDVWQNQDLFNVGAQAGAPPDDFTVSGQNWGFPTYNWPQMKATQYQWWKSRLRHMEQYFDATRIDHILGFFRIWSIPVSAVEGILGYFQPAIPIYEEDLKQIGVHFPVNRLYEPYIHIKELKKIFSDSFQQIADEFLEMGEEGYFQFKEPYNNQRKLDNYFKKLAPTTYHKWLRQALMDMHASVVLIKDPNSDNGYHFRFNMQHTASFKSLHLSLQHALNELYHDYFFNRQNQLWKKEALEKLPVLKNATQMLICGEDLGFTPNSVPEVMHDLGLLGLYVQRMPKMMGEMAEDLSKVPYLSVVSPSTHDTSSLRGWWLSLSHSQQQLYYRQVLHQHGESPTGHDLPGWLNQLIIRHHLQSPAMWSIFLMQDLLNMEDSLHIAEVDKEQINHPENPDQYWRYRMPVSIEQLLELKDFNKNLKEMVESADR
ncbi:4-alpha-glucanotransferase [Arachidicoccus rhizosphaerae]|uniref:4-alpha-glucanotransferase n=1 Tax=Arachidicoccus rhizosphaerae TaxID=551991 RepID=A0A1H4B9Q3_9BACT|nr:4-alpha-glucanotransferase [Arachidicoccus rhizosphaerae]